MEKPGTNTDQKHTKVAKNKRFVEIVAQSIVDTEERQGSYCKKRVGINLFYHLTLLLFHRYLPKLMFVVVLTNSAI
jgi:hypothetical protein